MSWQRIDENTYIDDTLVTCAEYQLFIDEMREQGKYYQPDHWTSYQFPAGQAKEPILGVRFSDGLVFCNWLAKQKDGKLKYRPPTANEAIRFPLTKTLRKELMGYWLDKDFEFAWINPEDTKNIEVDKNIPSERIEYSARARVIIIDGAAFNKPTGSKAADETIDDLRTAINKFRRLEPNRNDCLKLANQLMSTLSPRVTGFTFHDLFEDDIRILGERIAGRYPPYEGLRLVKELM